METTSIIGIGDIARAYQERVGELYNDLVTEAGERVVMAANNLVAQGVRGDALQAQIDAMLQQVAGDLCRAEGMWALTEDGTPRENMCAEQRRGLLSMMEDADTLERLPPESGRWVVEGEYPDLRLVLV
ncbi:MAG: hypothetical protein IKZ87_01415 [Actinomycetaceae bacterium]|nr:hypothetical protein [Actinomycetaceae bacterium]